MIELLAVIIILGVLLLIAIPSVTEYISTSRKKTYIATAGKYIGAVVNKVNALDYNFAETDTLYYVPVNLIELEKGGKSPYGEWIEAYVVVTFDGESYKYYWTSVDDAGMGIELTLSKELSTDKIQGGMTTVNKGMVKMEGKRFYSEVNSDNSLSTKRKIKNPEGSEPESYIVTFDCNEVECIVNPREKEVEEGDTYGELPQAVRVGYAFLGWYTEKEEGEWIKIFTTVELTTDQTLYAHWEANTYTISYDCNGISCSLGTKEVTYGSTYGELAIPPERVGYSFEGWHTLASGGSKIESTTNVTITANQTLYARWKINTYTISYDCNGVSCSLETKEVTYGSIYGELPIPPTREGYTFDGWYTSSSGGSKIESTTNVTITTNQTLYARWKELPRTLANAAEIGDYVNYDAGTWTETKTKPTSSAPFTFGGYTSGNSRNLSVACNEVPSSSGWRVLSKNASTGEVKLIHAGQPECYYHPNMTNSRGNSEKILSGSTSYAVNSSYASMPRDWSMYVNSTYALSATAFTKEMLDNSGLPNSSDLIKTNAYYWLGTAYSAYTYGLVCVYNYGGVNVSYGNGYGIRPVVTMKANITTTGKVGNVWQLQ